MDEPGTGDDHSDGGRIRAGCQASTAFDVAVTLDLRHRLRTPIADLSLASGGYKETYTLAESFFGLKLRGRPQLLPGLPDKAGVALAGVSNGTLTVTSVGTGTADIKVIATSGTVSKSIEFEVTVTQNRGSYGHQIPLQITSS